MRVTPTGEGWADEPCNVCKELHPLMTEQHRKIFADLGMTEAEIDAIAREAEQQLGGLGVARPHIKPSDTKEARAERKRRSRARQKAATSIPTEE